MMIMMLWSPTSQGTETNDESLCPHVPITVEGGRHHGHTRFMTLGGGGRCSAKGTHALWSVQLATRAELLDGATQPSYGMLPHSHINQRMCCVQAMEGMFARCTPHTPGSQINAQAIYPNAIHPKSYSPLEPRNPTKRSPMGHM